MSTRSLLALFCLVSLLLAAFGLATRASESQQPNRHRTIDKLLKERNEPVLIRAVKVNENKIRRNKKFVAGDDWIRALTIEIKNRSAKTILFASIQPQFPNPPGREGPIAVDEVFYGSRDLSIRPPNPTEVLQGIAPNETAELKFPPDEFEDIRMFLEHHGHSRGPERLNLRINTIIFDDNTMWKRGSVFRMDASSPYGWSKMDEPVAAKNGSSGLKTPVKTGILRSHHSSFWAEPILPLLFPHALQPQSCKNFLVTDTPDCEVPGWSCKYDKDLLGQSSGCFYLGAGSFRCKTTSGADCNGNWHSSQFANSCSGCGGGGGGGGGGEGGDCWSDWDCDVGSQCCEGTCHDEDDLPFGCNAS